MDGTAREPRVTVVVATRDRSQELCRTLSRLGGLDPRPPVVVVDNGSTDGTAEAVRERFPWVRLLHRTRNLGCAARNVGAARARTPYVAFCDDDSWWEPGSLEAAADALDAHPDVALVTASVRVGPEGRPDPVTLAQLRAPLPSPGGPGPRVLGFLACAAVVRRTAFEAVGGFEPLLFFGGEEELLALDLAAAGWEMRLLPSAVVSHHPSRHRPPSRRREALQERNALLTVWLRRSPAVVRERTLRVLVRCPSDPVPRHALAGALLRLPAVLVRRRRLPARVERDLEAAAPS
ncbi:glycosyltransferase family 2 protein [Nocardiopsis dassonvillei]|uniref:glycosyltransferase family 2 protein n=1 Tax=Nocardiopsis dassonvillei TaxID=2014 RepID=UPI003F56AE44